MLVSSTQGIHRTDPIARVMHTVRRLDRSPLPESAMLNQAMREDQSVQEVEY